VAATDPGQGSAAIDPETFFEGSELGRAVYGWARKVVPDAEVRVTRSQVALRRRRGFAWLWRPTMYLGRRGAEVVFSMALPREDPAPRWKEVVHPSRGTWMHHLEVANVDELDDQVAEWLLEAAANADRPNRDGAE
jgi:hypothetical protein